MKRYLVILFSLALNLSFGQASWWYGNAGGSAPAGPDTLTLTYWDDFILLHIANTGITEDVNGISAWQDRSGNGNHSTQSVNINKPSTDVDGNVVFDGTNDYLESTFYLSDTTTEFEIYLVFEVTESGAATNVIKPIEYQNDPNTSGLDSLFFNVQLHSIDANTYDFRAIFLRSPVAFAILDTLNEGTTYLYTGSSVETQQDSFFLNNVFKAQISSSNYYETTNDYGSSIGSNRTAGGQYFNGIIKFIGITKRRFTAAERTTTNSELNSFFTIY